MAACERTEKPTQGEGVVLNELIELLKKMKKEWDKDLPLRKKANEEAKFLFILVENLLLSVRKAGYLSVKVDDGPEPESFSWVGPWMQLDFGFSVVHLATHYNKSENLVVSVHGRWAAYRFKKQGVLWLEVDSGEQLTGEVLERVLIDTLFDKDKE